MTRIGLALIVSLVALGACKSDSADKQDQARIALKDPAPAVGEDAAGGQGDDVVALERGAERSEPGAAEAPPEIAVGDRAAAGPEAAPRERPRATRPNARPITLDEAAPDSRELRPAPTHAGRPGAPARRPGATPADDDEAEDASGGPPSVRPQLARPERPSPVARPDRPDPDGRSEQAAEGPARVAGTQPPPGGRPGAATPAGAGAAEGAPEVERILPLGIVRELLSEPRLMPGGPLAGRPSGPGYASTSFIPTGRERFGASIQVWQEPTLLAVNERFRRMRTQYPNAQETKVLEPQQAFFSHFGKIHSLTFIETQRRMVVSVACGEDMCSQQALLRLTRHARDNL